MTAWPPSRDKLSDDSCWAAFETALGQHLIRVYDLHPKQVRLDSTTASSYVQVNPDGLFQFDTSRDLRPVLPQLKLHLSALDPLGLPLSSTIVSGQRADDRLYVPQIQRVQQILRRQGLLSIGDGKMAALATRASIASSGDFSLCPLSNVHLPAEQLRALLQAVWSGEQGFSVIERTNAQGQTERIAEGFERWQEVTAQVGGKQVSWQERLLLVRSLRLAQQQVVVAEAALSQALRQLGWQVYVTNHQPAVVSLNEAVLAYRSEYLIERDFSRLKGILLSLRPMYLGSEDRINGRLGLLLIGLRVLTLLEFTVWQQLAVQQEPLVGLYAGQPKRATTQPTAEKRFERL